MTEQSEHVLFVTLSNIGDAVMTTPVLTLLERRYQGALVDIVARPKTAPLFAHYPRLGRLIVKPPSESLPATLRHVAELRRQRYLAVLDLRSPVIPWLLRTGRRYVKRRSDDPDLHAVLDHVAVFDRTLPESAIPPLALWNDPAAIASVHKSAAGRGPLIGVGPGAQTASKIWPAARYAALVERVHRRHPDACFVLFGDERDAPLCRQVAEAPGAEVLDLSGRCSLAEVAAWLGVCSVFVGSDSGLGHIAAAMGTPTLTLFGGGNPVRYRPWHPSGRWIVAPKRDLNCLDVDRVQATLAPILASCPGQG